MIRTPLFDIGKASMFIDTICSDFVAEQTDRATSDSLGLARAKDGFIVRWRMRNRESGDCVEMTGFSMTRQAAAWVGQIGPWMRRWDTAFEKDAHHMMTALLVGLPMLRHTPSTPMVLAGRTFHLARREPACE